MIKPDGYAKRSEIMAYVRESGFNIKRSEELRLEQKEIKYFYSQHESQPFYEELVNFMTAKPVVIMVLELDQPANAISEWRKLIGPTDPAKARDSDPNSIRARFWSGQPLPANVVHGSDSIQAAERELSLFFSGINFRF